MKDADLEGKVYEWFDKLDVKSLPVIQRVFPGKETLQETLKVINEGAPKKITRGHLVASISHESVAADIRELLESVGDGRA